MTFNDIPAWFWMLMIALFVVPTAVSIFRNGIHLKAKNKLVGEVELDAEAEIKQLKDEAEVITADVAQLKKAEKVITADVKELKSNEGNASTEDQPVE